MAEGSRRRVWNLCAITAMVHDLWGDLHGLVFERQTGILTLPFKAQYSHRAGGPFDKLLMITSVKGYECCDPQKVAIYLLNRIMTNAERTEVRIEAVPELEIKMRVRPDFTIRIVNTGSSGSGGLEAGSTLDT